MSRMFCLLATLGVVFLSADVLCAAASNGAVVFPAGRWKPSSTSAKIIGYIVISSDEVDWRDNHVMRLSPIVSYKGTYAVSFPNSDDGMAAAVLCGGSHVSYVRLLPKLYDSENYLEMTIFSGDKFNDIDDKINREICGKFYFNKDR